MSTYQSKVRSPDDAVRNLDSSEIIVLTSYGGEPTSLINALIASGKSRGMVGFQSPRGTSGQLIEPAAGFRLVTYSPDSRVADAIGEGRAEYLPVSVFRACKWAEMGVLSFDAALIHISPPDGDGWCSFGTSADFTSVAAMETDRLIAQVNRRMPHTEGHPKVHVSRLESIVEVDEPLRSVEVSPPDHVAAAIGELVAELVPDRACIELGIGSVAEGISGALRGHVDLGIHSGLFSDSLLQLVEVGAVTGAHKEIDVGMVCANQITGSERLYEHTREASDLRVRPATYMHDPNVISKLSRFVAINSALEVDFSGQVNGGLLKGRQIGGVGGSLDFAIGASVATEGISVIALPSTAGGGKYSRIVPSLTANPSIAIPGGLVDYVVTEHGVADLRGRAVSERKDALRSIAHPSLRGSLSGS